MSKKDIIEQMFSKIVEAYGLPSGDIDPMDELSIRSIVDRFIQSNQTGGKSFTIYYTDDNYIEVKADSKEEALEKFHNGEYDETTRTIEGYQDLECWENT